MKINEFHEDPEKTNGKQVAYLTEPTLNEEVFRLFSQRIRNDPGIDIKFSLDDGLLIVRTVDLSAHDLDRIEELLTEAEKQVQRMHQNTKTEHEQLLQRISQQTGRSLRKKPPGA
jgi:hypothetical protein